MVKTLHSISLFSNDKKCILKKAFNCDIYRVGKYLDLEKKLTCPFYVNVIDQWYYVVIGSFLKSRQNNRSMTSIAIF